MPSYVLDVFGARLMPVVYGAILTAWGCGGIAGPQLVAALKDNFGGNAAIYAFILASTFLFAGLILAFGLDNKKIDSCNSPKQK
jgi:OFA family oxalate/formate antiporter-like MFS transporter